MPQRHEKQYKGTRAILKVGFSPRHVGGHNDKEIQRGGETSVAS